MSSEGVDIEAFGSLQKKNRSGYYQNRYFKTTGSFLKYWPDEAAADRSDEPAAVFDLRDCKSIERPPGGRQVNLIFSESDKFKLELKFLSDEDCTRWTEVLLAKRALYSVSKLLVDLDDGVTFRTRTFGTLMLLTERDRSQWIEDRLNDVFEAAADEARTKMLRSDPMWVIGAARMCIEELLVTCEECSLEMGSRDPKVMAHCRSYMHRYADMIKGRLALELSFFTTTGSKRISEMGERALCAAIGLMTRMDALRSYTFMPHDLLPALNSCLFSVGELMSALLNLSIERIEAWFRTILALPPLKRGARLVDVIKVLANTLKLIDFQTDEDYLHQDLLFRVAMSILLNFSDQLVSIDLSEYDEQSLIAHIRACHKIAEDLPSEIEMERPSHVQTAYNNYVFGHSSSASTGIGTSSSSTGSKTTSPHISENNLKNSAEKDLKNRSSSKAASTEVDSSGGAISGNISNSDGTKNRAAVPVPVIAIQLPEAVIDSVESACLTSARTAVVRAVHRLSVSTNDLLGLLFQEKLQGWIGGAACDVYLNRFQSWLHEFAACVPPQYEIVVKVELARLVVRMYVDHAIKLYQDKKRFSLGVDGVEQISSDISAMQQWLDRLFDGIGRALEEYTFLGTMHSFLSCPEEAMLPCYAAAVQSFGIQYALHIYDLFRLFLKMRKSTDCKRTVRRSALGLCAEFLSQLRTALAADITLMSGTRMTRKVGRLAKAKMLAPPTYAAAAAAASPENESADAAVLGAAQLADLLSYAPSISMFEELCPKVGVEHCTGKKWGLEKASDPIAVRMLVARLVNETIASARSRHRESMELLERSSATLPEKSIVAATATAFAVDRGRNEAELVSPSTPPVTKQPASSRRISGSGCVKQEGNCPGGGGGLSRVLVDAMATAEISTSSSGAARSSPKSAGGISAVRRGTTGSSNISSTPGSASRSSPSRASNRGSSYDGEYSTGSPYDGEYSTGSPDAGEYSTVVEVGTTTGRRSSPPQSSRPAPSPSTSTSSASATRPPRPPTRSTTTAGGGGGSSISTPSTANPTSTSPTRDGRSSSAAEVALDLLNRGLHVRGEGKTSSVSASSASRSSGGSGSAGGIPHSSSHNSLTSASSASVSDSEVSVSSEQAAGMMPVQQRHSSTTTSEGLRTSHSSSGSGSVGGIAAAGGRGGGVKGQEESPTSTSTSTTRSFLLSSSSSSDSRLQDIAGYSDKSKRRVVKRDISNSRGQQPHHHHQQSTSSGSHGSQLLDHDPSASTGSNVRKVANVRSPESDVASATGSGTSSSSCHSTSSVTIDAIITAADRGRDAAHISTHNYDQLKHASMDNPSADNSVVVSQPRRQFGERISTLSQQERGHTSGINSAASSTGSTSSPARHQEQMNNKKSLLRSFGGSNAGNDSDDARPGYRSINGSRNPFDM